MLEEVLMAGFGGQGILLMGKLLAQAAMEEGLSATWLPSYGPEMRGGTANCIVVFSDDEVGSPVAATYDAVVVMNQPSLEKFQSKVKPGGTLLINRSIIPIPTSRVDVDVHYVDANDLAEKTAGDARCANVVMLGAFQAARPRIKAASLEAALRSTFAAKKEVVVEANLRAFRAGQTSLSRASRRAEMPQEARLLPT